jgi:hypothetical protein
MDTKIFLLAKNSSKNERTWRGSKKNIRMLSLLFPNFFLNGSPNPITSPKLISLNICPWIKLYSPFEHWTLWIANNVFLYMLTKNVYK